MFNSAEFEDIDEIKAFVQNLIEEEYEKQMMLEQGKLLYGDMSGPFADSLRGPEYDRWKAAMDEQRGS